MKNKGYIYIFTLLTITLMAIFFYFIHSFVENSSYINFNKLEKINSKYMAESALNIAIADSNFKNILENLNFKDNKFKNLNNNINLENTEIKKLTLKNISTNYEDFIEIETNIKYKDSLAAAKIRANYINNIYKEKDGVLNSSKLDPEKLTQLKEIFRNHNFSIKKRNLIELNGDFKIKYLRGNTVLAEEIVEYNEETGEIKKRDKIIKEITSNDIIYQKSGNLNIKETISPIFLIINDKVMFNDNNLFGIIVLNENAIIMNNCELNGYLIDLYDKNNSIKTKYSYQIVRLQGVILPEFIKFQPISLKHYDLEN